MQTLSPAWNVSSTSTAKWYVRAFPSLADLAFLLPVFLLFTKLKGTKALFADGDTGWHIRTGEWIIQHRAVPTLDLFSFTKPNQHWFAWEWGWDVLFATIHRATGLAGVGFVNVILLGLFSALLYALCQRASQNHAVSFFVSAIAICASSIHWLARPHLFSLLFTVVLLHLIQSAEQGRAKALYFAPPLMILWTNIHGGFLAGILILCCQAAGLLFTSLLTGARSPFYANAPKTAFAKSVAASFDQTRAYWVAVLLSALATLANPYGWHLHQHIFRYLSDKELLNRISEFQSLSFHSESAMLFETMLVLGTFAAFWKLQSGRIAPALLMIVWAHFALLSARHIPLFAIVAAPSVADLLQHSIQRLRHVSWLSESARTLSEICEELGAMERPGRLHIVSAASILLLAVFFAAGKEPFAPEFDSDVFPAQAIPFVQARIASGAGRNESFPRIFTYDQWGDYLLYRLYPAQKVFFDGRSDFYGIDFVKTTQRIAGAEHDWKKLLRDFSIEMVILKPEAPLAAVLKITPGAKVLFDDGKVIVFQIDGIYQANKNAHPGTEQAQRPARTLLLYQTQRARTQAATQTANPLDFGGPLDTEPVLRGLLPAQRARTQAATQTANPLDFGGPLDTEPVLRGLLPAQRARMQAATQTANPLDFGGPLDTEPVLRGLLEICRDEKSSAQEVSARSNGEAAKSRSRLSATAQIV